MILQHLGKGSWFCGVVEAHVLVQIMLPDQDGLVRFLHFYRLVGVYLALERSFGVEHSQILVYLINFEFQGRCEFSISRVVHFLENE